MPIECGYVYSANKQFGHVSFGKLADDTYLLATVFFVLCAHRPVHL